jgi:hydroxyethylthiazole kinase
MPAEGGKMDIYSVLEKVRKDKPLVHHLTNWVTIYDCANIVKVFGASPVMAHAVEEAEDMAKLASSLVLNIGTLTTDFVESMKIAAKVANKKGIPVMLDACGAGATPFRDEKCFELLEEVRIDIIKGNASEIARIAGENVRTKGVDATDTGGDLIKTARGLSEKRGCTVVITGKEDIIFGDGKGLRVKNGHTMMGGVVGTGCMASSVIGTFAAVHKSLPEAAAAGLCCFEIAAELAAKKSEGPGDWKVKLFNMVSALDRQTIEKMQKVEPL